MSGLTETFADVFAPLIDDHFIDGSDLISTFPSFAPWWEIASLDPADIIEAWSFDSRSGTELTGEINAIDFEVADGAPVIDDGRGLNFDGASTSKFIMPGTVKVEELSVIVEFENWQRNSTLDAVFSHHNTAADPKSHFVLQQDFDSGSEMVRWSCGDDGSGTLEVPDVILDKGTYGVSGPKLYQNGGLIGVVPDPIGTVDLVDHEFTLGGLLVDGAYQQYAKMRVKKIIVVRRLLTSAEQYEIAYRMEHHRSPAWYLAPGLTTQDVAAIYDFAGASNKENALKGEFGPNLEITRGAPGWTAGEGFGFGGGATIKMKTSVNITPGEATIAVRNFNVEDPPNWVAFVGFENRPANAVLIQHHPSEGVAFYNGKGYNNGGNDEYVTNPPIAQDREWLFASGNKLYRNGVAAANELNPEVQPPLDVKLEIGSSNGGQYIVGSISHVLFYRVVLTKEQIGIIMARSTAPIP